MLEGGEDPRFIARRMVILASEDVGNADPRALVVATAAAAGRRPGRPARVPAQPRPGGGLPGAGAEVERLLPGPRRGDRPRPPSTGPSRRPTTCATPHYAGRRGAGPRGGLRLLPRRAGRSRRSAAASRRGPGRALLRAHRPRLRGRVGAAPGGAAAARARRLVALGGRQRPLDEALQLDEAAGVDVVAAGVLAVGEVHPALEQLGGLAAELDRDDRVLDSVGVVDGQVGATRRSRVPSPRPWARSSRGRRSLPGAGGRDRGRWRRTSPRLGRSRRGRPDQRLPPCPRRPSPASRRAGRRSKRSCRDPGSRRARRCTNGCPCAREE